MDDDVKYISEDSLLLGDHPQVDETGAEGNDQKEIKDSSSVSLSY